MAELETSCSESQRFLSTVAKGTRKNCPLTDKNLGADSGSNVKTSALTAVCVCESEKDREGGRGRQDPAGLLK